MGRQSQYKIKRDDVLGAIRKLTAQLGGSPSLREISAETGVSIATLHSYLDKLQDEGAIEWQKKTHRSITLRNAPGTLPPSLTSQPVAPPVPPVVAPPIQVAKLEAIDPGF